jgi:hypothetical protein
MSAHAEIHAHIERYFRGHQVSRLAWLPGPAARLWPQLYCLAVAPGPRYSGWVYLTVGSSLTDATPRLEFLLCSPRASDQIVELLSMVAHYHASEGLNVHHTLPIGRAWLQDSLCDQLFVSLPYPFGPELEVVHAPQVQARILWLVPITLAERRFAVKHGAEALESLFDEHAIDVLDSERPSVVS